MTQALATLFKLGRILPGALLGASANLVMCILERGLIRKNFSNPLGIWIPIRGNFYSAIAR